MDAIVKEKHAQKCIYTDNSCIFIQKNRFFLSMTQHNIIMEETLLFCPFEGG